MKRLILFLSVAAWVSPGGEHLSAAESRVRILCSGDAVGIGVFDRTSDASMRSEQRPKEEKVSEVRFLIDETGHAIAGAGAVDKIRVGHGIVSGRQFTGAARAAIGCETGLVPEPLFCCENLASWQVVEDLRPNLEIPVDTAKPD